TVANGGSRIAPHLVEGIYESDGKGGLGTLTKTIESKVLNKVDISSEDMDLIHQGFYQVVNGTDAFATGSHMRSSTVTIAGATGTAATYGVDAAGNAVTTIILCVLAYGYSGTYDSRSAVAVSMPHLTSDDYYTRFCIAR